MAVASKGHPVHPPTFGWNDQTKARCSELWSPGGSNVQTVQESYCRKILLPIQSTEEEAR